MTQTGTGNPREAPDADGLPRGVSRLGGHWGLVLAFGLITWGAGLVLVFWPGRTLVVLAVVVAVQLVATGLYKVVDAMAASSTDGGSRALLGLSGGLSLLVGLLCLRAPLQTVVVMSLLLGAWLVVHGTIDLVSALLGDVVDRVGKVLMGIVSLAAGAYLVVNPDVSLQALVVVVAVWLFGYGAIVFLAGLQLRSAAARSAATTTATPT